MKRLVILTLFLVNVQVFSQTYNATDAADAARRWCNGRNPAYYSYNVDCANFVSQCLKAGGLDLSLGAYGVPVGHSLFCSLQNEDANRLYSEHTNDRCDSME